MAINISLLPHLICDLSNPLPTIAAASRFSSLAALVEAMTLPRIPIRDMSYLARGVVTTRDRLAAVRKCVKGADIAAFAAAALPAHRIGGEV
jgi:hypothetical protein